MEGSVIRKDELWVKMKGPDAIRAKGPCHRHPCQLLHVPVQLEVRYSFTL